MARPETPIDPRTGPQAAFAVELRQLRELAGLTYRKLAQRAHYSQGALCEAARGRQLPSWEVTKAFVAGCGGDEQQWRARWEAAAAEIGIDSSAATALGDASDVREPVPSSDVPSLSSLTSPQEFHLALRALRSRAGNPSLRGLSALARKHGGHVLPRSTLADALTRTDHLPSLEIVEAFLSACGVPAAEVDPWKSAWIRVAYLLQRDSTPGGRRWQTCPYLGLAAFTKDQAEIFHGRRGVTADLLKQLDGRVRGGVGMLVVTGPSGAGKSSLLQAGLLPVLENGALGPGSEHWPYLVITPGSAPLDALAVPLAQLAGVNSAEVKESLAEHPDTAHLTARQALLARLAQQPESESRALPGRLVLIVDQFEELFTVVQDKAERAAFITSLCAMAGVGCGTAELPPAIVVLGLRADFISHCAACTPLAEAARSSVFMVGPMTEAELQLAITGPAKSAGLSIEAGLVDDVLAELRSTGTPGEFDPGALPLLSQAMLRTWEHREGTVLTRQAYVTGGGLRNSIQTSAEAAYANLAPGQQEAARTLFRRMVTFTDHGQPTRCTIQLSDLDRDPDTADDLKAALEEFANQRLVTLHEDTAEIVHEVLLHTWQRLESWIAQDREWLRLSNELAGAASVWEKNGQDPAFLYHGSRLAVALESLGETDTAVPSSVQLFLDSSRSNERRRTRTLRSLRNVVALLVVVLLGGVNIWWQYREHVAEVITGGAIATKSRLLATGNPYGAMLLAVEAYHRVVTSATRDALLDAQSQYLVGHLDGHTQQINKVVFSPDWNTVATASDDGTTRLWGVANRGPIATLPGTGRRTVRVTDAEFSPDGSMLVTAGTDGIIRLWKVASRQPMGTFPDTPSDNPNGISSAATFSPDNRYLAIVTSLRGTAQLWDVARHRLITSLPGTDRVTGVVYSPSKPILATIGTKNIVRLWNVAEPQHPTPLGTPLSLPDGTDPINAVATVAFSLDGSTLAAAVNGMVRLWNVKDPLHANEVVTLNSKTDLITAVAFITAVALSPDGRMLVTAGSDGTARLWDIHEDTHGFQSYRPVGTLNGHHGAINSVAFHPDGHTVATAGADYITRLWDTGGPILSSLDVSSYIDDLEFTPNGRALATFSADGTSRLWDIPGKRPIPLFVNDAVGFGGDGRLLVTMDVTGTAHLWDRGSRRPIATLGDHVKRVVFSPNGHMLATTDADHTTRLWDVTDSSHPVILPPFLTGHIIRVVAFSGDGRLLATVDMTGTAHLWDIAHQHLIAPLSGPTGDIVNMVFSRDGGSLVAASDDGTVRRWETTNGTLTDTVSSIAAQLPGKHHRVALSPDGRILATASSDGTKTNDSTEIKLWNIDRKGTLSATLASNTGSIHAMTFSPDGTFLAMAGADDTVRLWDLNPRQVVTRLCGIIGTVSKEQWENLMPNFDYHPTPPACPNR